MSPVERLQKDKMMKKAASYVSEPEDDEEEVDETFLALQKLLRSMNNTRSNQVTPMPVNLAGVQAPGALQQQRMSQEELLESRRREREQFRHFLLSKGNSSRRRCPAYNSSYEEDDDDDTPTESVESTISNRFINGSFSRLNVHVISRNRWATEEVERLPIILLPKNAKYTSPAENPKVNVTLTDEHMTLKESIEVNEEEHAHYLTPPRATWHMQSVNLEGLRC